VRPVYRLSIALAAHPSCRALFVELHGGRELVTCGTSPQRRTVLELSPALNAAKSAAPDVDGGLRFRRGRPTRRWRLYEGAGSGGTVSSSSALMELQYRLMPASGDGPVIVRIELDAIARQDKNRHGRHVFGHSPGTRALALGRPTPRPTNRVTARARRLSVARPVDYGIQTWSLAPLVVEEI